jgi:broad specificity phosphatase PhoE
MDAQARIVSTVTDLVARDESSEAIAIVSHGAVGTLLYCHLAGLPISRQWDQPPNSGGNYFEFSLSPRSTSGMVLHWWRAIDAV